jgi:Mg/Co/Ni transporter MgtE
MSDLNLVSKTLLDSLAAGDIASLYLLLQGLPPGESARLVTRLDSADQRKLLTLLPSANAAQLLQEMTLPQAAQLLRTLEPAVAASLVELFPSNEQVDVLIELGDGAELVLKSLLKN